MIISHQHRFIFFAVPKTATHSVREALRVHTGEDDWEQQMLFGEQLIPIAEIASIKHGHISAREISAVLPQEQWQKYFKFAFVRNPFDRFISACAFLNRGNPCFAKQALGWMKQALQRERFRQRVLIRPQAQQLCDVQGDLAIDYVGRYELLQQSFDTVLQELALEPSELEIKNRSEHTAYRDYYDAELREQVAEFYQQDLSLFGYSFD